MVVVVGVVVLEMVVVIVVMVEIVLQCTWVDQVEF